MKIAIVSTVNVKHMTLISKYTSLFRKNSINFDLINIDKYDEDEDIGQTNQYKYKIYIDRKWSFYKKLKNYIGFYGFSKRIIKKNEYDYLVIWNSFTGVILFPLLLNKMRKKYILNIRDYAFEKNKMIYFLMSKLVSNSIFTTISSRGFLSFLPKSKKYVMMHSFNEDILSRDLVITKEKISSEPIRICFIGNVRFFENDKKLLESFKNDQRFVLQFFGQNSEILEEYARLHNIKNVEFVGRFDHKKTRELLKKADVINNLYGHNNIALDTAISIKFYYALYLSLPILVYPNTFIAKESEKMGNGYIVNEINFDLPDKFYKWYTELDHKQMSLNCQKSLSIIKRENKAFENKLESFLNKIN